MSSGRREKEGAAYWDNADANPLALGCVPCPDLQFCGGIHTRNNAYNCLSYCCNRPEQCDAVCPRNPTFVDRIHEIRGFDLHQLARAPRHIAPSLPSIVPLIYNKGKRRGGFSPEAAALSLYHLIDFRNARVRYDNTDALREAYGLAPRTPIVLSGTEEDSFLEKWWHASNRLALLAKVRELGIGMVTAPNFSVFSDQPRHDDFHAMKRIGAVSVEIAGAGIPVGLHVNARTERDYQRWGEFLAARPEFTTVAFEFGTGAGAGRRTPFHIAQLKKLAMSVDRPLDIIVRGALKSLSALADVYRSATFIDTTIFLKTANRWEARLDSDGVIRWITSPERPDVDLDQLLDHNYLSVRRAYEVRRVLPVQKPNSMWNGDRLAVGALPSWRAQASRRQRV